MIFVSKHGYERAFTSLGFRPRSTRYMYFSSLRFCAHSDPVREQSLIDCADVTFGREWTLHTIHRPCAGEFLIAIRKEMEFCQCMYTYSHNNYWTVWSVFRNKCQHVHSVYIRNVLKEIHHYYVLESSLR